MGMLDIALRLVCSVMSAALTTLHTMYARSNVRLLAGTNRAGVVLAISSNRGARIVVLFVK
jgi:hypothetical protein